MEEYYVVESAGTGEIVEKKSRFISHVIPVDSEQQALENIEKIKKKYWDARHNCFAFVIGKNNEIQRFSDDGEPQGTAGKPILEVLTTKNVHNTLIVVTRYFGGTLLGTGGLVRAYGQASKAGLDNAQVQKVCPGIKMELIADYNSIGKIKYIMGQMEIAAEDEQYAENVIITVTMKSSVCQEFSKKITDATNGKTVFQNKIDVDYKENV
ncbi:MAG: YigZ family protein [Eubacterium sp.]